MCAKPVQQPDMPEYFYLRPKSRNWQVRLSAPQKLIPHLDKPDYRQSTGTSDRGKAKVIGAQLIADKLQEWEALAADLNLDGATHAPTHLSAGLIEEICDRRLASWLRSDEDERFEEGGLDDQEFQELVHFCELTDAAMRAVLGRGPASSHWIHALDAVFEWCFTLGLDISAQDPLLTKLVRSYAAAERLAMDKLKARNAGEEIPTPGEPKSAIAAPSSAQQSKAVMSAITPLYEEDKSKTVGRKSVSKNISIWNRFVTYMGDACLDSISSRDVYYFLQSRLDAPDDYWSTGYTHGPVCTALSEIFALARTLGYMTAANPVTALESKPAPKDKARNAKKKKPRFPFTNAQINKIYQSKWYDPNATNWTGKMGSDLAGRYWPPLISNLHGLRGVEALQLIADDFDFSGPVPLVTFKIELADESETEEAAPDAETSKSSDGTDMPKRSQKNEQTRRTLPVHPKLIELGIVTYVNSRKSLGGSTPLFESSLPEPGGKHPQWGRSFSQRFLPLVRDTLSFGRGYGNHSWRHKFEDAIRAANVQNGTWPAGVPQLLSGRKMPRKVDRELLREVGSEDGYGTGYEPIALLKYLVQLDFPEINFPPPFEAWIAGAVKGKVGRQNRLR